MRRTLLVIMVLAMTMSVYAHGEETFAQAEEIIDSKVSCEDLSEEQLAMIGDYYMEQMHPGEQHERMDAMMGGEGSEQLEQMHINMARSFYCGEHEQMQGQPMNMMMGGGGMMGDGMMDYDGRRGWSSNWLWGLLFVAIAAVVVSVIFWGTYRMVGKKK